MKKTPQTTKALEILKTLYPNGATARQFAGLMWKDTHPNLFTKVSNQGNGACRGKAAWLSAGSFLSKLQKKNLVRWNMENGFYITQEGFKYLENEEAE